MKNRNYELDFWKFIAAIFVVLVHSYSLFDGEFLVASQGRLAVEFFFIVTGFLFAHSIIRDRRSFSLETIGLETWHFLWRKTRSFLPFYVIGFALAWCGLLLPRRGGYGSCGSIINVPFDFLLLRETGFPIQDVFGVNWYLSTMLMTLFLFYPIFRCKKMFFSHWIAPFLAVVCYGVLFMHGGHLDYGWRCNDFVIIKPNLIRAIAGICLLLAILAIPVCMPFQKWLMSFDGSDNKKGESAR